MQPPSPPVPPAENPSPVSPTAAPQASAIPSAPAAPHVPSAPSAITHYENFPVASWLCPPALRAPIAAIYHFARTADDLADEGDADAAQRLSALERYRAALVQACQGDDAPLPDWPEVFGPLRHALRSHQLPPQLLHDLLDAFVQDTEYSRDARCYHTDAELLDYCRRSANPVGRLLLHLYGVHDTTALQQSDAICSALQLINFWQDLSVDIPRGRYYLPTQRMQQHGVSQADVLAQKNAPNTIKLIADCTHFARALMQFGSPLVHRIPGRAGWELRLVVQGGLRILDKIEALGYRTLDQRPRVRAWDGPLMLWRSSWM